MPRIIWWVCLYALIFTNFASDFVWLHFLYLGIPPRQAGCKTNAVWQVAGSEPDGDLEWCATLLHTCIYLFPYKSWFVSKPITNDVIVNIDPEWKFAVFLRDPAERLLSAYLDKVNGTSVKARNHFLKTYNLKATPTFEEFIKAISKNRTEFEFRSESETKLQGVDWCELLLQGIIHRRTCDSNRTLKFLFTLHWTHR